MCATFMKEVGSCNGIFFRSVNVVHFLYFGVCVTTSEFLDAMVNHIAANTFFQLCISIKTAQMVNLYNMPLSASGSVGSGQTNKLKNCYYITA